MESEVSQTAALCGVVQSEWIVNGVGVIVLTDERDGYCFLILSVVCFIRVWG